MVQIMEEADLTRPQQAVLVAMAENAWDDGSHCYPSVDKIAWKAGYKPRNVTDIIRELRHSGVLEVVKEASGRRPTEYRIVIAKAPRKATFEEWQKANGRHAETIRRGAISRGVQNDEGCNLTGLGVQNDENETRENAPRTVSEPLGTDTPPTPSNMITMAAPKKPDRESVLMDRFERWYEHYPKKKSRGQAEITWRKIAPSEELTERMIEAVKASKLSDDWKRENGRFILNPSTWLNAKGWLDDIATKPAGPAGVQLLPGEVAKETEPGHWELSRGDRKRYLKPSYFGVVWDPDDKHRGPEGTQAFYAAVEKAKRKHEQEAA